MAVVTLFNPEDNVVNNIKSYLPYVKELLIVDNSLTPYDLTALEKYSSKVTLLSSSKNLGISKALNLALSYAKDKGYKWLMTMDQDSYFEPREIQNFMICFNKIKKKKFAIYSPLHNKKFLKNNSIHNNNKKRYVMTSANILNISKALDIGGFDENLFIDEVDHDFCLRLGKKNYKVIENHNCFVNHTSGKKIRISNVNLYSSKRLYYMARNYLYIRKKHKKENPEFFKTRDFYLFKFIVKQLIHTEKKIESIRMIFRGIKDYYSSKMGYRVVMW